MRKLLIVLAVLCVLGLCSCIQPPANTVVVDLDGKPALAVDADSDGVADVDEAGEPLIVPGSEAAYGYADTADSALPTILQTLGGIIGVPLLVVVGRIWGQIKPARIFANTIMTIQAARQKLKDKGLDGALAVVDETLGTQTTETTAMIRDIKAKFGVASVK